MFYENLEDKVLSRLMSIAGSPRLMSAAFPVSHKNSFSVSTERFPESFGEFLGGCECFMIIWKIRCHPA